MKNFFLALLCSGCTLFVHAQMLNTGMLNASVFNTITSIGTVAWSNVSYIQTSNNSPASSTVALAALGSANTRYVSAENFGLAIPTGAIIEGIQVRIKRRAQGLGVGSSIKDNRISILKRGTVMATNMAKPAAWTSSYDSIVYGTDTSKWGTTWTAEDINDAGFGAVASIKFNAGVVGISLTAQIDHIQTIVFYTMPPVALPVELIHFDAQTATDNTVTLNWATAMEINNSHFAIERSNNALMWSEIATVVGNGNSTVFNTYNYIDDTPLPGVAYYRLKQYDYDGAFEYSPVASANTGKKLACEPLELNYSGSTGQLFVKGNNAEPVTVQVYDISGKMLDRYSCFGNEYVQLPIGGSFTSGMYILAAYTATQSVAQKVYR